MSERIPLAAILAGGRASRMGKDKADILIGGIPLIERVVGQLAHVVQNVFVVGGAPRLDHLGIPTIPDRYPGADAMGGIATALAHAAVQAGPEAWVLCVACDTPFLKPRLLLSLFDQRGGVDLVVPRSLKGYEPLCALYRATCLPAFERAIAERRLRIFDVYPAVNCREILEAELRQIDPDLGSFANINRPEDLALVRRAVARGMTVDGEPSGS